MGKTKIKLIDESQPEEVKPKKKLGRSDALVEKLKAELGAEEEKLEVGNLKMDKEDGSLKLEDQTSNLKSLKPTSKPSKPGKSKPRSKKYQEVSKDLDRSKTYPLPEALDMVKNLSYAKFNATIEAHINTAQTGIRGYLSLPYAAGKKLTILAFGKGADSSGADKLGDDSTIEEISKGKVNFDLVVTTPEWMPKLAKVARILGPKGLMPNPKNGTITEDLKKAVEGFQAGKTEYKTEPKAPVIHLGLGKVNQPTEELSANIKTLLQTLGKTRVKKVSLSPTMGPSVKVDLSSL